MINQSFRRKTVLLTESFPPSVGGIQRSLSEMWKYIPAETTVVIARQEEGSDTWDADQSYRIVRVPTNVIAIPRWRPALVALRKVAAEHKPEVVLCGKALFEGRAALKLKHEQGIPYVLFTYGMEINTWIKKRKTRNDLIRVLHDASRVVCINENVKSVLHRIGVPSGRIVKMYPGVSDAYLQEVNVDEKNRVSKTYNISHVPHIITVCRLVSRKGVDTVLRSLPIIRKEIPDIQYTIVGEGPERKQLEYLAKELGISECVRFLGNVADDDVLPLFGTADAFVMTPREEGTDVEGFGIVYIEAAAAGLPSVASRTGGVPEAVQDETTGILVSPDNPKETADALLRLLKNPEERKRLAKNAKLRAWNDLNPSRRVLLLEGIIEATAREYRSKQ